MPRAESRSPSESFNPRPRVRGDVYRTLHDETKAKFEELRWLETSIGAAGMRALQPLMHTSRQDLWQLYMLEKS